MPTFVLRRFALSFSFPALRTLLKLLLPTASQFSQQSYLFIWFGIFNFAACSRISTISLFHSNPVNKSKLIDFTIAAPWNTAIDAISLVFLVAVSPSGRRLNCSKLDGLLSFLRVKLATHVNYYEIHMQWLHLSSHYLGFDNQIYIYLQHWSIQSGIEMAIV